MTRDLAIDVAAVHKRFGAREVLSAADLQVGRGELVGLVGKNGAGKSTLMRILVGLGTRTAGRIEVLGLDPAYASLAIRRRSCYLPGETSVYAQMTGRQFIDFALSFYPRRQEALLADLHEMFELPLQQKVRSYSAGMKQKLALIATLVPDVELYLLDEPDRALDASVRFQLRDVLLKLRNQGRTLLLSSHHLSEVESLCERLEFLLDGRFVPAAAVAAARARLQRQLRVRLLPDCPLPTDCRLQATEPDGTLVLETPGSPLLSLALLPPGQVVAAEVGSARLEDLYKLLLATVIPAAEATR